MNPRPSLVLSPRCRVIVDNDFSGDPDGLVGLAHHLLSPTNRVVAITSSFLNPKFPVPAPRAEDGAGAPRRMYTQVDFRLLVGDLLAKPRTHNKER